MRWIRTLFLPALFTILPASYRPGLLFRPELWLAYLIAAILIISQPSGPYMPAKGYRYAGEDRWSAIAIIFAHYLLGIGWITLYLIRPLPAEGLIYIASLATGSTFAVLGLALRVWSIRVLGAHFTTSVHIEKDQPLLQSGPYRWIRHPSYTGSIAAIIAIPMLYSLWVWVPISAVIIIVPYLYRVRVEEVALQKHFGSEYASYATRAGTFLPRIFPKRFP